MESRPVSSRDLVAVGNMVDKFIFKPKHIIVIGHDVESPRDDSVIVANGPIEWMHKGNNVNFGSILEGDSDTGDMIIRGNLDIRGEFGNLQVLDKCDICDNESDYDEGELVAAVLGWRWGKEQLCATCVKSMAMQHHAREQWAQRVGDPIANLQREMAKKDEEIAELKAKIVKIISLMNTE